MAGLIWVKSRERLETCIVCTPRQDAVIAIAVLYVAISRYLVLLMKYGFY